MVTKLLEEEALEEVGSIDDGENKHGGEVDGEDGVQQPLVRVGLLVNWFIGLLVQQPAFEHQGHLQTRVCVACIVVGQCPETICPTGAMYKTGIWRARLNILGSDASL